MIEDTVDAIVIERRGTAGLREACEVVESVCRWPPQTPDSTLRMQRIRNIRVMFLHGDFDGPTAPTCNFDPTAMVWPAQIRLDAHIRPLRYSGSPIRRLLGSSPRPKEITLKPTFERARVGYHCSRAPLKDQSPGILICPKGRHLPIMARELHNLSPPRAKMYPEIEPYQRGKLEVDGHSL